VDARHVQQHGFHAERLLALEVSDTEARRLPGRLRFASLPSPASLPTFDYDAAIRCMTGPSATSPSITPQVGLSWSSPT
jgi:hypothetical protein